MDWTRHYRLRSRRPQERFVVFCALSILVLCFEPLGAEPPAEQPSDRTAPFFGRRALPLEFNGPGRETPEPEDVTEVRIGYFGPADPDDPAAGDLWCAASLAIEEANREGGWKGKPFRLVARWSDDPWKGGAAELTKLVYEDRVWAIVGGIDSASTHLAEQVTTKARLPLVAAASSDRSANAAIVPWFFSLLPGDHLQAPVLAEELDRRAGREPFVLLAGDDHGSRSFAAELQRSLTRRGLSPRLQFTCRATDGNTVELVERSLQCQPAAAMVVADAELSARLVRALRSAGFSGAVLGGPSLGRRRFLEQAGPAAEGVVFPQLIDPGKEWGAFAAAFSERWGRSPDFAAAATCDAVRLLVDAIRQTGLNRARIGDKLRGLSPWQGVAGVVRWDNLGGNTRPAGLGTLAGTHAQLGADPQ